MRRTLSLGWWLAIFVLLAGLFSLLAAGILGLVFQWSGGRGNPDPIMALRTRVIHEYPAWTDPAWQQQLLPQLQQQGIDLVLADGQGKIVFQSSPDPLLPLPAAAWRYPNDDLTIANSFRSIDVLEVQRGGGRIGSVRLYHPWPATAPTHANFGPFGGAVLVIAVGIALAVAVMAKLFLPPLHELARAAHQIRAGQLIFTFKPSPVRELHAVQAAFSHMAQGLEQLTYRQAALEEERRFFLAAISHDLRTPLFSLRGRLEGIRDGIAATPERTQRYAAAALKTLASLDRLVADLFAYARVNLLAQDPRQDAIDWCDLLRKAAETMQPAAEAKGVRLKLATPAAAAGMGDAHLLGRAIANLLDNAIRYTPAGGEVGLGVQQTAGETCMWVEDSGPGIDPADLPLLFTPRFQGKAGPAQPTGGAGLGLAIVQAVVKAHQGRIEAANRPGGGARFALHLPNVARP